MQNQDIQRKAELYNLYDLIISVSTLTEIDKKHIFLNPKNINTISKSKAH